MARTDRDCEDRALERPRQRNRAPALTIVLACIERPLVAVEVVSGADIERFRTARRIGERAARSHFRRRCEFPVEPLPASAILHSKKAGAAKSALVGIAGKTGIDANWHCR